MYLNKPHKIRRCEIIRRDIKKYTCVPQKFFGRSINGAKDSIRMILEIVKASKYVNAMMCIVH